METTVVSSGVPIHNALQEQISFVFAARRITRSLWMGGGGLSVVRPSGGERLQCLFLNLMRTAEFFKIFFENGEGISIFFAFTFIM